MSTPLDPDERKAAILSAALSVFPRYGFKRATMDDVAREANLSRPVLYLSYQNKAAIFASLATALARRTSEAAEAAWPPGVSFSEGLTAASLAQHGTMWALLKASPHGGDLLEANSSLTSDLGADMDRRFAQLVASRAQGLPCRSTAGSATRLGRVVAASLHGIKESAQSEKELHSDIAAFARLAAAGAEN